MAVWARFNEWASTIQTRHERLQLRCKLLSFGGEPFSLSALFRLLPFPLKSALFSRNLRRHNYFGQLEILHGSLTLSLVELMASNWVSNYVTGGEL